MSFRRDFISKPIFAFARGAMPAMSDTEREALEATARGVARERWHVSPRPATPPSATTTAPT